VFFGADGNHGHNPNSESLLVNESTSKWLPELRPYLEDLATLAKPGIETPLSDPVFPRFINSSACYPKTDLKCKTGN
jgi:hypothetical protein